MEYDGNNTQGHNLKVASEGTSKSSSVSRSYAFPRFDIDESLQGHLRFDSLVETDAFLGIQSQDDNQWIEDFSRESDVINFSSGATESCTIGKQNNVWSEAASLESVEMLLKSVGQEQIQSKDTVSENISTFNELRSLDMEPKIEQDNASGGSTRISNATILQNELLKNFSAVENHVEGKLSTVEEISLSQESLIHGDKSSSQMYPNGLDNEGKLPVAEEVVLTGTECDKRNMQVAECPIDVCLDQIGDGLSPSAGPAQDINATSSILAPSPSPAHGSTHSKGEDDLTRATADSIKQQLVSQEVHAGIQIMEHHKLEDDLHTELPCSYTSSAECVDKKPDIEVIINSNESSLMSCARECQFELVGRRDGDNSLASPDLPGKGETDTFSTSKVIHVASTVSDTSTDNSEQHVTKLDNPNAACCSNSEANMDSVGDVDEKLSSDGVDNMAGISHKEGVQGKPVLGSYSIKGEKEPSKDKISNADAVDLDESIKDLHGASADDMVGSRSSDCREDLQVEADQQCNARESENISVETKKEKNVSLPTSLIDVNPGTPIPIAPIPNSGDCSRRSEVQLDCNDSVLNKDPLKLEISSATIISSDVLPPDDGKQKCDGGSEFAENKPPTSEDLKGKDTALDDNSFTFKVNLPLIAEREKANTWTLFPIAETYKSSVVLEGVTTPDIAKTQASLAQETSGNSPGDNTHGTPKATSGRRKRGSAKKVAKEILQKGVNKEEITPDRPSHKEEKAFSVSLSPGANLPGQFVGSQPHGLTKRKSKKLSTKNAVPTSELPDLNASVLKNRAVPSAAFYQTFTELQQLQLRAQIFVYGSLIQGTAPDEACMVSAFGPSDRGRGVWDQAWQAAVERVRRKKSQPGCQSPMSSHSSGAKVPDIAGKQVSPETMVPSSASQTASKGTSMANLSPKIPLSSPLWSISTPYHDVLQSSNLQRRPILHYQPAVSPRPPYHNSPVQNAIGHTTHRYHTPPVQNVIGHTTQQSQAPASPSPWVSQTFTSNVNVCFSTTSVAETIKLTPFKDFTLPVPSSVKVVPSPPLVYTDTTSTVFARSSQLPNQNKGNLSSEVPPSTDSKPRRRKKSQPSDNTPQNPFLSRFKTDTVVASSPLPTLTSPCTLVTTGPTCHVPKLMTDVYSAFSTSQPQAASNLDAGKACAHLEETVRKVEHSKVCAEEADILASTAESHCQSLWSQLPKQTSDMTREAEVQVVALAGAAAAAASVAKAAAAVAKVASSAALQAKMMADETFFPTRMHMLTSDGGTNQSSSLVAGQKETTKRKIEAENLESILEAAKLAGEAVSQAGKVVAMGEPLPLKELISAGPEGYWKLPQASSELVKKSGDMNAKQININSAQVAEISNKEYGGGPPGGKIAYQGRMLKEEPSYDSFGNNARSTCGISESIGVGDKDPRVGKTYKSSDVVQSNRVLSVQGISSENVNIQNQHELNAVPGNNIKEGSVVEVYKDGDDLKPAWFSANVLTLHDGKALVEYTYLLSKEDSENHKEWVALEGEGDKAPRIRAALPLNASNLQGTRKRRRSVLGDNAWIVGDLVDVWMQDRWCEGAVTEKNEKDESSLTVHFPARGETSSVSTKQLRHSRIWTNGNWVQWSRLRAHDCSDEGDMPHEKRPRLKSPLENESVVGKPEESRLQALSGTGMVFNVGKNSKAETKPDTRKTLKTGLQKEGSRGVFGVPKPGRKRKLVEVSKQFPATQNIKDNESKDQVKFAKYLMPLGTTSRARRNLSKVDYKERQSLRVTSLKPHSSSSRTVPQKDNVTKSALDDEKSGVREEDSSKTASLTSRGSSGTYETGKGPLDSSLTISSSSTKPDLLNKGKVTPALGRLTKVDEEKVSDDTNESVQPDVDEPRRSNRRIQPTHKLLEGLQSSMIIPKMTSISHDKGQGEKNSGTSALPRGK